MYRALFRIGVLAAAAVIGGTALAAASATQTGVRNSAATQVSDPDTCIYLDGVWYCWPD